MYSFPKEERLCGKKNIGVLLSEGNKYYLYPFAVKWMELTGDEINSINVLIAVPKSIFKKSVDRNKIKRLTREAYRRNKDILTDHLKKGNKKIALMFMFKGGKIESYQEIETKIKLILQFLAGSI